MNQNRGRGANHECEARGNGRESEKVQHVSFKRLGGENRGNGREAILTKITAVIFISQLGKDKALVSGTTKSPSRINTAKSTHRPSW